MGLDVSVYKNIKITDSEEDYDFIAFVISDSWLYKIKNLEDGKNYEGEVADAEIGYSYSTHSRFRDELCKMTKNENAKWREGNLENTVPFFELLDFADNEGCLDWDISEKLYNEFEKWKVEAIKYFDKDKYFLNKYLDWLNIFKTGKDKGVVVFH